jgi:hypothetical protein
MISGRYRKAWDLVKDFNEYLIIADCTQISKRFVRYTGLVQSLLYSRPDSSWRALASHIDDRASHFCSIRLCVAVNALKYIYLVLKLYYFTYSI